jgi:hypothetical protein
MHLRNIDEAMLSLEKALELIDKNQDNIEKDNH